MARDVRLEMNLAIRRHLDGRLVDQGAAGDAARDLVRKLQAQDPALLLGWLQTQAVPVLAAHIARRHPAPVRNGPGPEAIAARKAKREQQTEAQAA